MSNQITECPIFLLNDGPPESVAFIAWGQRFAGQYKIEKCGLNRVTGGEYFDVDSDSSECDFPLLIFGANDDCGKQQAEQWPNSKDGTKLTVRDALNN